MRKRAGTTSPRTRRRCVSNALGVRTAAIVLLALGRPAAAQTVLQLDGALGLYYSVTTPSSEPGGLALQLNPSLVFQTGSERQVWRVGYAFAGTLNAYGAGGTAYSNTLNGAFAAELTDRATMTVSGGLSQGGTALLLSQRPADTGQPGIRPPGNPNQVSASLSETLAWELSPRLRLSEAVVGAWYAPQDSLGRYNASVGGSLQLRRTFATDAVGGEISSVVASFSPLTAIGGRYLSVTNSVIASWRHDLDPAWSGELRAGVAQVVTFAGSFPLAVVPTGRIGVQYQGLDARAALAVIYGPTTELQTGAVTQTGSVTLRGLLDLPPAGVLTASAGLLRSRPLEPTMEVASGVGDAAQGDIGFIWGISTALLATARGTVAYQFGQPGGIAPSLLFVILVGVTAHYSNAAGLPPMPAFGQRADDADAVGFSKDAVRKR
jgi:hypothetical protein